MTIHLCLKPGTSFRFQISTWTLPSRSNCGRSSQSTIWQWVGFPLWIIYCHILACIGQRLNSTNYCHHRIDKRSSIFIPSIRFHVPKPHRSTRLCDIEASWYCNSMLPHWDSRFERALHLAVWNLPPHALSHYIHPHLNPRSQPCLLTSQIHPTVTPGFLLWRTQSDRWEHRSRFPHLAPRWEEWRVCLASFCDMLSKRIQHKGKVWLDVEEDPRTCARVQREDWEEYGSLLFEGRGGKDGCEDECEFFYSPTSCVISLYMYLHFTVQCQIDAVLLIDWEISYKQLLTVKKSSGQ